MNTDLPKRRANSKRWRVALLVHTSNEWIRLVLRGVAGYAHEQGEWDFFLEPVGLHEPPRLPADWQADGIITRLTSPAWGRTLRRAGVPAVNVSWMGAHSRDIPKVASDEAGCGQMVARHFLDRGFRNFGYIGPINRPGYNDNLSKSYEQTLANAGFECVTMQPPEVSPAPLHLLRGKLKKWISSIPKPIALLVWNSEIAREITFVCHGADIDVPIDVAVLCIEFDSVISSLAPVPLSNLDQAGTRVGYEAARLLHQLMEGAAPPESPVWIPPVGIVQRQSTDTMAVADELVADAARYVAEHVSQPIKVEHLCKALDVSRRNLETRFIAALGRTPAAEIRRARIERAKRLLVETDLPLRTIAKQAGFNHTEVMIRNFSKQLGVSPGQFRRSH